MDNNPNSIEFSVKKKTDSKIMLMRMGIAAACYIPFLVLTALLFRALFVAIPVLFVVFSYGVWFFFRFTQIEYEYSILSGDFSVSAIYNNLQRKTLIETKIKDMTAVVPYEDRERYLSNSIQKIFYYCSDLESKDLYICVFNHEKYGKSAIVFNSMKKFVQIMKFYNPQNVVMKNDFIL